MKRNNLWVPAVTQRNDAVPTSSTRPLDSRALSWKAPTRNMLLRDNLRFTRFVVDVGTYLE